MPTRLQEFRITSEIHTTSPQKSSRFFKWVFKILPMIVRITLSCKVLMKNFFESNIISITCEAFVFYVARRKLSVPSSYYNQIIISGIMR